LRPNSRLGVFLLVLLAGTRAGLALESSGGNGGASRETSELRELSTKPLVIYSARGRQDPFVAPLVLALHQDHSSLKISELVFVGVMESHQRRVALFRSSGGREQTFTLRGGKLYGAGQKAVPNVTGRILPQGQVVLKQGEETLAFSASK
jgi:hypothetical protein